MTWAAVQASPSEHAQRPVRLWHADTPVSSPEQLAACSQAVSSLRLSVLARRDGVEQEVEGDEGGGGDEEVRQEGWFPAEEAGREGDYGPVLRVVWIRADGMLAELRRFRRPDCESSAWRAE